MTIDSLLSILLIFGSIAAFCATLIITFLHKRILLRYFSTVQSTITWIIIFLITLALQTLHHTPGPKLFFLISYPAQLTIPLFSLIAIVGTIIITPLWWIHIQMYSQSKKPPIKTALAIIISCIILFATKNSINNLTEKYERSNAKPLISFIESYKSINGEYPDALDADTIAKTKLIGSTPFYYIKQSRGYYLMFEIIGTPINSDVFVYDPYEVFSTEGQYLYGEKHLEDGWRYFYRD